MNTERNRRIAEMRQQGLWPTEIAEQMGLSRNAVLGVLFRAGLCRPDTDTSDACSLRARKGSDCPKAKLTEFDVLMIRRRHVPHCRKNSMRAIAQDYGVHYMTVRNVIVRNTWAHV